MDRPSERYRALAAALLIVLVGCLIYANSLSSPFVCDDLYAILENPHIESVWPLSSSLHGPPGSCVSGRPLAAFSLALNHALGGVQPAGYHVFNITAHVLAALALFGLVRCTVALLRPTESAVGPALAVGLLWLVHPLHTDALNHVVYRTETLMALFYLLTLFCAARGMRAGKKLWFVGAVLACSLAMASKEVAVSAPLAVLVYDRTFVAGGFGKALRARPGLYVGLALTWVVLGLAIASGDRGESAALQHTRVETLDYMRAQVFAVTHYLRLALFPYPLVFDYHDEALALTWADVWPRAIVLAALALGTLVSFLRRKAAGFLGFLFFAVLAPTSSFIVLRGEVVAEHRMVLPLVAVCAGVVWMLRFLPRASVAVGLCVIVLGALTVRRNIDYQSAVAIWSDTAEKRPGNARAHSWLGTALLEAGDPAGAEVAFTKSLEVDPDLPRTWNSLGVARIRQDDLDGALEAFAQCVRMTPRFPQFYLNHYETLRKLDRDAEAVQAINQSAGRFPGDVRIQLELAWILATSRDASVRRGPAAVQVAERVLAARDKSRQPGPRLCDVLAAAYAEVGRFDEAVRFARLAVRGNQNTNLAQDLVARLRMYRARQPYRE